MKKQHLYTTLLMGGLAAFSTGSYAALNCDEYTNESTKEACETFNKETKSAIAAGGGSEALDCDEFDFSESAMEACETQNKETEKAIKRDRERLKGGLSDRIQNRQGPLLPSQRSNPNVSPSDRLPESYAPPNLTLPSIEVEPYVPPSANTPAVSAPDSFPTPRTETPEQKSRIKFY